MRWRLVRAVFKKEVHELIRDPFSIGTALVLPVIMLLLFGYALNFDVENVPTAVLDQDQTSVSREYIQAYDSTENFNVVAYVNSMEELEERMEKGEVKVGLVIPPDFSENLYRSKVGQFAGMPPAVVQTLVDGSFSPTATVIIDYVTAINQLEQMRFLKEQNIPIEKFIPLQVEPRIWYNPSLKSDMFIIPGLFAVLLMVFPPLLSVLAVVREKEKGSIQQIYIAPIRSLEFLLGKLLPYGILAMAELFVIFIGGVFLFDVEYRGNILLFLITGTIFVFTTVGIGLLISTLMKSQLAAMFLTIVVTMMPAMLFSGFLYPISTLPPLFQGYSYLFPTRFFVDISRGILVKGLGLSYIWLNLLLLLVYTGVILMFATWRFKKRGS
ncbi:ABC transporter permease [Microaerobacter geothermalis]|uniref:ABC transporter permease n=1 Tax=Microaerobacter geothermalis TaxID=674972 RepID=UPI001F36885C|nr:ABC transporter permease [Microaerobacter geothermalis]MCF6093440.1 ABC transporter permease [Microaerobacter geothermalis]